MSKQQFIRFLLNGKPHEIDFGKHDSVKPSTTLLNYLRSHPNLKGTKEGCAEGDCGACTVVVATLNDEKLVYKAINSCLVFLPWVHGKHVITVEGLATQNQLHPVQQQLIDLYGSQCGFCTPGIVLSLFALYKSGHQPERAYVEQALNGNLCRCTGYQPIMDAALNVLAMDGQDQFTAQEPDVIAQLQQWQHQSLEIHHPDQHYLRPANLFEALAYRSQYPQARLVNGGSDVAIAQSKRFEHIPQILDLSNVGELKGFKEEESFFKVGAGLCFEDILVQLDGRCPSFVELMEVFASKQIRNLATLGGNIGSASPIGDTLPLLMAMGASVELISMSKKRIIGLETFVTGYRSTDLQADELIKWVLIPKKDPDTKLAFSKASKRKDVDISTVSFGARLRLDEGFNVAEIALVYGGMAQMVRHAVAAEDFLRHKPWTIENIEQAAMLIEEAFQPISDARAAKEARTIMAGNLLRKFFHQV